MSLSFLLITKTNAIVMHYDYMNFMIIQRCLIFFPVYIISYYDVRKPIIVMFSVFLFFGHYDCSLLKILPSFPELVCSAVIIIKRK